MTTEVLNSIGLYGKVAKIYITTLNLGTVSVRDIALKSGIKRPTAYTYIDELVQRGLFEKITVNKRNYYRAADPRMLEDKLKASLAALQSAMPEFEALRMNTPGKPRVVVYEGEEGVRAVYREMGRMSNLRAWSNVGTLYASFRDVYMELAETVKTNGVGTREIIADTKEARRYSRLIAKVSGPTYATRIAVCEGLANDAFIYGNTVALFRLSENNMFVVRVEDATIAASLKALFDMAWKSARPFR